MVLFFDLFHLADAFLYDNAAADVVILKAGGLTGCKIFEENFYRCVTLLLRALCDSGADVAALNLLSYLI